VLPGWLVVDDVEHTLTVESFGPVVADVFQPRVAPRLPCCVTRGWHPIVGAELEESGGCSLAMLLRCLAMRLSPSVRVLPWRRGVGLPSVRPLGRRTAGRANPPSGGSAVVDLAVFSRVGWLAVVRHVLRP
jgi:hypothetical protein